MVWLSMVVEGAPPGAPPGRGTRPTSLLESIYGATGGFRYMASEHVAMNRKTEAIARPSKGKDLVPIFRENSLAEADRTDTGERD